MKKTRGSVVVRHQDVNTHALLTPEQTVKDHAPSGEAYPQRTPTKQSVRTNGREKRQTVTTHYECTYQITQMVRFFLVKPLPLFMNTINKFQLLRIVL